jgi:tetratricopeptide (TPR) repeat protein
MSEEEIRERYEQAGHSYSAGDFQAAGELYSSLFVEPEATGYTSALHWNYAMCLAHLGDWETALEHVRAGGHQESDFRQAMQESNVRDARHDFAQAMELYNNQQWSEAADAFTALTLHTGLDASAMDELHWNIAMCLAHLGDYPTALEHVRAGRHDEAEFRRAMRTSNVNFAREEFRQAVDLYHNERWSEAADAFTELMINPGVDASAMDELHWNLAMCLANQGDWDTAFGHIRAGHLDEAEFRRTVTGRGLTPPDAF